MPAQWLNQTGDLPGHLSASLDRVLQGLARPASQRRLRQLIILLFALWVVWAFARLVWALLPAPAPVAVPQGEVINPVTSSGPAADRAGVDIDAVRGWHLFGEAGAQPVAAAAEPQVSAASAREGIEKGARETRLQLVLRGVVASSEDGLGHAIIEHKKKQDVYAVDDKLPVSGNVVLAKVMPLQVVLDNGGKYELLTLFDDTSLDRQLQVPASQGRRARPQPTGQAQQVDKRNEAEATALAQNYRQQLYQNPQSLADVVSVNAVREGGELLGYRIAPGRDRAQFESLGFKAGDLVTAVNGIALNDPANTMRLYQTMRTASEAVFDLQRDQQAISISVSLGDTGAGQ